MAQTTPKATTVTAPVTSTEAAVIALPGPPATPPALRPSVADGSITDHVWTEWVGSPSMAGRCGICGKAARRHADSIVRAAGALIAAQQATHSTDKGTAPSKAASQPATTEAKPVGPAGKKVGLRRLKADPAVAATARLAKTSASKAAGGRRQATTTTGASA